MPDLSSCVGTKYIVLPCLHIEPSTELSWFLYLQTSHIFASGHGYIYIKDEKFVDEKIGNIILYNLHGNTPKQ